MRRRLSRIVELAVVAMVVAAGLVLVVRHYHVRHFSVVEPGRIYRSGRVRPYQWPRLHDRFHVRTVIDLRDAQDNEGDQQPEGRLVRSLGMTYHNIAVHPGGLPTTQQAEEFLALMEDRSIEPVLIHCKRGRDRTGIMVALYRVAEEGWPVERALGEMLAVRNGPVKAGELALLEHFQSLKAPATRRQSQ